MEKPSLSPDTAGTFMSSTEFGELPTLADDRREGLPPFDLRDPRTLWFYKNSDDEEMITIVSDAERWARTMQRLITEGASIEEIWKDTYTATSDLATEHGLRLTVAILARCWQHGDSLGQLYSEYINDTEEFSEDSFYG